MKNPKAKKSLIPKQDLIEKMKLKKEEIRFKIKKYRDKYEKLLLD